MLLIDPNTPVFATASWKRLHDPRDARIAELEAALPSADELDAIGELLDTAGTYRGGIVESWIARVRAVSDPSR